MAECAGGPEGRRGAPGPSGWAVVGEGGKEAVAYVEWDRHVLERAREWDKSNVSHIYTYVYYSSGQFCPVCPICVPLIGLSVKVVQWIVPFEQGERV